MNTVKDTIYLPAIAFSYIIVIVNKNCQQFVVTTTKFPENIILSTKTLTAISGSTSAVFVIESL
ncbi:MAG: hypothetical protein HC903_16435 [Methylacidiphilales bacterium]|nr:hypothetical protein [Candidatus Methylacidiphilales bacterium]